MEHTEKVKKKKEYSEGVVMTAIGHPYYSHLAYTLAVSLRFHNPDINLTILHDGSSLNQLHEHVNIFDKQIQLTDEQFNTNGQRDYFKFKLYLDELTPYDRTLFLDADTIWNPTKTPADLFKELKGTKFTISNRGTTSENLTSGWASMEDVKRIYGVERIYDIASEVIYFEGKPEVFSKAREVYEANLINVKPFGEGKPDEIYLSIAMALLKAKPHISPWHPTYWQPYYFKKVHNQKFIQSHYLTSIGGAFFQDNTLKIYNNLQEHYYNRMGVKKHIYKPEPKSKHIKGRRLI